MENHPSQNRKWNSDDKVYSQSQIFQADRLKRQVDWVNRWACFKAHIHRDQFCIKPVRFA
jgi:hypothetical protein